MTGYSGTPLPNKLGIRSGCTIHVKDAPPNYLGLLEPLPDGVTFTSRVSAKTDLVHVFSARKSELDRFLKVCRSKLGPAAVLWVSWPKKAAKVPTDITEDTIRELALPLGFVDVKVCAVTEVWSGLKLVVRKELRRSLPCVEISKPSRILRRRRRKTRSARQRFSLSAS